MPKNITVQDEILIEAPPEVVWDFTQDYSRRHEWDRSVVEARVVRETPERRVELTLSGGVRCAFVYKEYDRPHRTSLAMVDVRSAVIAGGGGSWAYEAHGRATRWRVSNTVTLRHEWLAAIVAPLVRRQLRRATRQALEAAKQRIESQR